jgi:F-type H+-transporting ATPase subunit epsilon
VSALKVELVAADRPVWSGPARLVVARTVDGEIGVLPGHESLLAVLADGLVVIRGAGEDPDRVAAVHGGFISVADDTVALLAETAELAEEIDVDRARAALDRARNGSGTGTGVAPGGDASAAGDGEGGPAEGAALLEAERRAETRLRAAETRLRTTDSHL